MDTDMCKVLMMAPVEAQVGIYMFRVVDMALKMGQVVVVVVVPALVEAQVVLVGIENGL